MAERRLSKTLTNLALALLNATLILVAICLFLAWQVVNSFGDISEQLTEKLVEMAPLRADVQTLAAEGAALRTELAALRERDPNGQTGLSPRALNSITELETRLSETSEKVDGFTAAPETLVVAAINQAMDRATGGLTLLAGCTPPDA